MGLTTAAVRPPRRSRPAAATVLCGAVLQTEITRQAIVFDTEACILNCRLLQRIVQSLNLDVESLNESLNLDIVESLHLECS